MRAGAGPIVRRLMALAAAPLLAGTVACCGAVGATPSAAPSRTPLTPAPASSISIAPLPAPSPTASPWPSPRITATADLAAAQAAAKGAWSSLPLSALPPATASAVATYRVASTPLANRDGGRISPTLVASYAFLQYGDIRPPDVAKQAGTFRAFFIRSALMSFVDYADNRTIRACNSLGVPVYLEVNYSDYVPGRSGTGTGALARADNLARTIAYLAKLGSSGLHVEGITFGDEWGDDNGLGALKPTIDNSDLVGRFVTWATALRQRFPALRIYAFDSYIGAARGEIDQYWDAFDRIAAAERSSGLVLLDGFVYRESYVYMDASGRVESSQEILDDTESLAASAPVYRLDTRGESSSDANRDYLHTLLDRTRTVFGRRLDLMLTEYLPAIDFVVHYADVVGTYASLGLDAVSTWVFANSTQQAKAYLDRSGHHGAAYPVHEQLAKYLAGTMLEVTASADYATARVKVYAAHGSAGTFVMLLNKDALRPLPIRVVVEGELDLLVNLPARSYSSLLIGAQGVTVSSVGA